MNYSVDYQPEPEISINDLIICPCYRSVYLSDQHVSVASRTFTLRAATPFFIPIFGVLPSSCTSAVLCGA